MEVTVYSFFFVICCFRTDNNISFVINIGICIYFGSLVRIEVIPQAVYLSPFNNIRIRSSILRIFTFLLYVCNMKTNDDEKYMRLAIAEAQLAANEDEVPVGAVVICNDRVIGRAHNMTEALNDVTAHAEMQAITAAANYLGGKYLTECTIYVTVEPCYMCAGAIGWSQMGRLVYGAGDPKRGYTKLTPSPLHPKTQVTAGVLEEECAEIMKNFFISKR